MSFFGNAITVINRSVPLCQIINVQSIVTVDILA